MSAPMAPWLSHVKRMGVGFWVVVSLGFVASIAGAVALHFRDEGARRVAFNVRAAEIQGHVETAFVTPLEYFYATRSFLENSNDVSEEDFSRFAGPGIRRNPTLTALEWAPLIRSEELRRFEDDLRTQLNNPRFFVWEPTPTGDKAPVPDRSQFFPVLFAEPPAAGVIGLDVTFEPTRRATVAAAIRSGMGTASARIRLAADPVGVFSMFVTMPVFRKSVPLTTEEQRAAAVRGLCIALFRLDPVFRAAVQSLDLGGYGVVVEDTSAAPDEKLLFATHGAPRGDDVFVSNSPMKFHDRIWNVKVWSVPSNLPTSGFPLANAQSRSERAKVLAMSDAVGFGGQHMGVSIRESLEQALIWGQGVERRNSRLPVPCFFLWPTARCESHPLRRAGPGFPPRWAEETAARLRRPTAR